MDDPILKQKYPAKAHCKKLAAHLQKLDLPTDGIVYLEGGKSELHEDCDQEGPFRSEQSLPIRRKASTNTIED